MNKAESFWLGVLLLAVLTAFGIYATVGVIWHLEKIACEAELPRNVSCVWAPPADGGEET